MSVRPRSQSEGPEDTSGQAGWIFADLILGLMVVFLATVSFIPVIENFEGPATTSGTNTTSLARLFPEPFQRVYENPTPAQVEADLRDFRVQNRLPENSSISFLEISGSYDPLTQDSSVGVLKAATFNDLLITESELFRQGVSVKYVGWPSGDTQEIRIKLYLIYDQEIRVN